MKLGTFFEKFDQFAEAPDAVGKMRELVLDLAVMGKLVAQESCDEPASLLLDRIADQRARLVAARKIKPRKSVPVQAREKPFKLPSGWAWTRLLDVGHELGQKVPDRRFTYIDVGGIDSGVGRISERVEVLEPGDAPSRARKLVTKGTVIYSTIRPYLLNIAIVDQNFEPEPIVSTAFGILHPFTDINDRYLWYWLRSKPFTNYVQAGMKGMAYPAINDQKFYNGPFPLPPLAEQKRIVAKVDSLMALCERLEAQQQERDTKHAALARASLARFAEAPSPANLQFLFHKSYPIDPADLRKSILTLAVQGKLVKQQFDEGNARREIENIVLRKNLLLKNLKIRKTACGNPINHSEVDHEIPKTWEWIRLVDICEIITDGTHQTPKYTESGRMFLSAKNVKPFKFMPEIHKLISDEHYQGYIKNRKPQIGDVLLTRVGAGIGEAATVDQNLDFAIYVSLGLIRPIQKMVFSDYITLWLNSPDGTEKSRKNTYGKGVSQGNLNLGLIRQFLVPLPPLAEQRRIVAKVDELMVLVDQLEAQLAASRATAKNLLEALVAELTAAGAPSPKVPA